MATQEQLHQWQELAQQLRVDSIRATTAAGSGHPTSSMSPADLMAVLLSKYLHYDFERPENPHSDRLILSKGHAAPLLYSMYKAAGVLSDQQLLSLRQFGSQLEGHPTPILPWVDVATGSLGQGLPIGVGLALAGKYLDQLPYNVWVLLGDSETSEGSIWEAFDHASHYTLDNLIAIIDVNRLGQRGQTELGWNTQAYANRARAFGWQAIEIDGHNLTEIDQAYSAALAVNDRPTVIIARTKKGKGVVALEDLGGWHGKALPPDREKAVIAELGGQRHITITVEKPETDSQINSFGEPQPLTFPTYNKDTKVATRRAYGDALVALGVARPDVVVLDAEVSNSTYAEDFAEAFPERYFEMYIAEQQMVAAAVGLQIRGYKPFASSFAAFLTRAYDFVRMAAVSRANIRLVGSHAGVSIGQDGASQMGLEDLAAFRAVWNSTVLYPCDANQTAKLVGQMCDRTGIVYLRTTRENTPVIYTQNQEFSIGGSKIVYRSDQDQATVIGAGITLHEAIKAYHRLQNEGISIRVIDAYSVKPIDINTLHQAARDTNGNLIVVEDHWPEGGLGAAVLDAFTFPYNGPKLRLIKLAVTEMPTSGTPAELLHAAKIDADAIIEAVKSQVRQPVGASI
ncbi:MAG TPA: transketolase [Nostocaceae cyanobacterium]|nr:transketolase [Nostocaceae cyanobacterium]